MGNDVTNLSSVSSKIEKRGNYEERNKDFLVSFGSENILDSCGELEESSPFSKSGIKHIKTTSKSSVLHRTRISSPTDHIELINDNLKALNMKTNGTSNSTEETLKEEIHQVNSSGEDSKAKIIKTNEINLLSKEPSDFLDMKITGDSFFKIRFEPIYTQYQMLNKIGEGAFGSVLRGKCLKTGEIRAVKILKKKIMKDSDQKTLMAEINILRKMDHISIIKLYDVFYYQNFFYVVTEYCEGGSLLSAIEHRKFASEKEVATIIKQIMSAINYMHKMKIAHRDLKLENVVLLKESSDGNVNNCLKLIDFGLACEVKNQFDNPSDLTGTLSYMAPEIFSGSFSCQSDVWSCGIILCLLLTKCNPYRRQKPEQTKRAIQKLVLDFNSQTFSRVNESAKNLLCCMLEKNPMKRITMEQALNHDWIKSLTSIEVTQQVRNLDFSVISNFNNFHRGSNFICFIKNYLISTQLTQNERQELAHIFSQIDLDSSGIIEKEELIQLYSQVTGATDEEVEAIIHRIDQNQSGQIDFQEFLLCMTNNQIMHNLKYISQAFEYLDRDHTGFIDEKELLDCLEGCEVSEITNIFKEFDFNKDGKIEKDEFERYLLSIKI